MSVPNEAIINKARKVEDDILTLLKEEKDNVIFETESDLKCFFYHKLQQSFGYELSRGHLFLNTEFLLSEFSGWKNPSNYVHPRMDVVLRNSRDSSEQKAIYGVELKFSYASPSKGLKAFKADYERMKKLHEMGSLDVGLCLWYESYYAHPHSLTRIKKFVEEVKHSSIKVIYLQNIGENHLFQNDE